MKKITFYLIIFYLASFTKANAQVNSYSLDSYSQQKTTLQNFGNDLKPMYYNYSRRKLFYNGTAPMSGPTFLEMCRRFNDPHVRNQIARYDQLTRNKKCLVGATIACGVGGYVGLMYSMVMTTSSAPTNPNLYTIMGVSAASLLLATPILAISTSIPHQKRKEIMFRDLPAAYNFYVESQPKQ